MIQAPKFDPRVGAFGSLLKGDSFQNALKAALPRTITVDRMIRVVLSAMTQAPKLLDCTPESVLLSVLRAAAMGLEPDGGPLGQGYLVPYFNGKTKRTECQFIPGYRGLVKLARNSGEIASVTAEVVYERDSFHYELGLDPKLTHKRNDEAPDPGKLTHCYAVARFRDGEKEFVVLNAREVAKVRESSKAQSGPWFDHEPEMWKKTAVRRLCKMLPLATDPKVAAMQANAVISEEATFEVPLNASEPLAAIPETIEAVT